MTKRARSLAIGGLLLTMLGGGAAGYLGWRSFEEREAIAAHVPARPDLSRWSEELQRRVMVAEAMIDDRGMAPEGLRELSRLYHANGFFDEARQLYTLLCELDPQNPRWPHLLASIVSGYGNAAEAVPLLQHAVKLAPDYVPAGLRLGDALFKTGRHDDGAAVYAAVLVRDPRNPYALIGLARHDLAAERWTQARSRLEQALAAHAGFRSAWNLLAVVHERLGETREAGVAKARASDAPRFREAPDPWVDELLHECYDADRLSAAASAAIFSGGDIDATIALLQRALSLDPDGADLHLLMARLRLELGEPVLARPHLERAVAIAPDNAEAWVRMVEYHTRIGNSDAARATVATGLAHCPNSSTLHLQLGLQLAAEGRLVESLAALQESRKLEADRANTYLLIARTNFQLQRESEGVAALRDGLAAVPDDPALLMALGRYTVSTGTEAEAADWIERIGRESKLAPRDAEELTAIFRQRFGGEPR